MKFHGRIKENKPFVIRYSVLSPGEYHYTRPYESWAPAYKRKYEVFYATLRESIEREGFRNPVLLNNLNVLYGNSRAWLAHELDIPLPGFIRDFNGTLTQYEEVTTLEEVLKKFKDKPQIKYDPPYVFNFFNDNHSALSRKRAV